jgi:cell wall-associated NlpC family hydrolase
MDTQYYKAIPFVDKGRDEDGCDCWGLVQLIYKKEFGIDLPDYTECYDDTDDKEAISSKIDEEKKSDWVEIDKGKEQVGDVVLLRMFNLPMHVGVVVEPRKKLIHTIKGVNVSVERYNVPRWKHKVLGFNRYAKAPNI